MSTIALDLETDSVALPPPVLSAKFALRQALQHRHSARACRLDSLSLEALSVLWASFGINVRATGMQDFVAAAPLNLVCMADFEHRSAAPMVRRSRARE